MLPLDPQISTAIVAGLVSLLVSVVVATWTQRKKLESDHDIALRTERLPEYRRLWALTEVLGWYGSHDVNAEVAKKLLEELDHWYFENGGGLLLSATSVDLFEKLLLTLHKYDGDNDGLRQLGSSLRYALSFDVGGKNRPMLKGQPRKGELEPEVLIAKQT
jgi:hypothetical protein